LRRLQRPKELEQDFGVAGAIGPGTQRVVIARLFG
jgi:hypothetical protein